MKMLGNDLTGVVRLTCAFLSVTACTSVPFLTPTASAADSATVLIHDHFEEPKHSTRKLLRGEWKVADGVASVTQDDELYRKYKDHGPILSYQVPHHDVVASIEFKPNGCQRVVFTLDAEGGGHAFRIILRPKNLPAAASKTKSGRRPQTASSIVTYTEKPSGGKAKPISLSREIPGFIENDWNRIEARVEGANATVTINGSTFEVQHPRMNQPKKIAKIGFAFGDFAIRKFELSEL